MQRPATSGSPFWARTLQLLILAIAWSPRLRLGAVTDKSVDLRVQDLLIAALIPLIFLNLPKYPLPKMRQIWRFWAQGFVFVALLATTVDLLGSPWLSALRSILFLGRGLELLVLAIVAAWLYLAAGRHAQRRTRNAINLAIWGNLIWMLYQLATGSVRVLVGTTVGSEVESYGPKLIGEPSAFGTGFFCLFAVAWSAANIRAHRSRPFYLVTLVVACIAAFAAQSRASLVAIGVIVVLLTLRPSAQKPGMHPFGALALLLAGFVAWPIVSAHLTGRLSGTAVEGATTLRENWIWAPLIDAVSRHPVFGIGPGALGTTQYWEAEAHNMFLRAALDYGIPGMILFVGLLATAALTAGRAQRADDPTLRLQGAFTLLVVLAAIVCGLVQESMTGVMSSHLTMLSIGLFAAVAQRTQEPLPAPVSENELFKARLDRMQLRHYSHV